LDGQRAAIESAGIIVCREFQEIESGRKNQRPILMEAVEYCKATGATLVVAKLDRLARDVAFMFAIQKSGIDIQALDVPELNTLTIGIFATMAQYEAELISKRTKAALDAKRRRGDAEWRVSRLTMDDRRRGAAVRRDKSRDDNRQAIGFIRLMMETGRTSYHKIARRLNDDGFKTKKGRQFTAVQVRRLAMSAGLVPAMVAA
jgi:DNA invertase Pin-like site-specific DNA recombinase